MTAPLCQIALSVADVAESHAWYRQAFGLLPASGTNAFKGFFASRVQGIPDVASSCWWLMDGQDFFQLELFQFHKPKARPLPDDWRPSDIGYSTIGLWLADFDGVLERLAELGTQPLTEVQGTPGRRRVCVRDPQGVLLELLEEHPLESGHECDRQCDAAIVSVTLSVADLAASGEFFRDLLGLDDCDIQLHGPEHEALWQLPGASSQRRVLRAGQVLVELAHYPDARPRPDDYCLADLGILNIAIGYRSRRDFNSTYRRCLAAGVKGNWRPLDLGTWKVVYVNDPQGFSVELLHVLPVWDARMGFKPGIEPPAIPAKYARSH